MSFAYSILTAIALTLPLLAHAETVTTWSFLAGQLDSGWQSNGDAQVVEDITGISITAQSDVALFRRADVIHPVEAVSITYMGASDIEAKLLWHQAGLPEDAIVQLPFMMVASSTPKTVDLDVRRFQEWNPRTEVFGLQFPAGTQIQLLKIDMRHWNILEKLIESVKSYWTFDTFTPYSVNFLWGPILTPTSVARDQLFDEPPPRGVYANSVWYVLLVLTAIGCIVWGLVQRNRMKPLLTIAVLFVTLWFLSDLRMGAEALSYAYNDWKSYWSQPLPERRFRERVDFPVFLTYAKELLADRERYIFLTSYPYPFLGLMRYHTYPLELLDRREATEDADTWIVFEDPKVTIDKEQRLSIDGAAVSPPGTVLMQLRPHTFVFRSTP